MLALPSKINILKSILNRKIEKNDCIIDNEILQISRELDILIVEYERQLIDSKNYSRQLIRA